jgi:hypothetical protein
MSARDDRRTVLRGAPSETLAALLTQTIPSENPMISAAYLLIAMHPLFKETKPMELFDLIVDVMRERFFVLVAPTDGGAP